MSGDRVRMRAPWLDGPDAIRLPGTPAGRRQSQRPPRPQSPRPGQPGGSPMWVMVAGSVCGALMLFGVVLAGSGNKEAFGAVVTGPILLLLMWTAARRLATADEDPQLVAILMGAFCLKLVGSLARYWVAANVYGTGDFYDYDKWGRRIAAGLRHGHLVSLPGRLAGTNFMRFVTGFIYFATPSRMMSGFLVYGALSFAGLLFFWRAYRVAISSTSDRTYLKWLVLLPSLMYWPSAIGKDAFMVLAAGIAAYGAACLFKERLPAGLLALSLGIGGMSMVRPHFALAVCGGLMLALVLRRHRGGFMAAIVSLVFVTGLGFVVVQASSAFFGISALNRASVVKLLSDASTQTNQGGSQFKPVVVRSPIDIPLAAVTVLYRPLPFEAHSPQEMLTALEGVALAVVSLRTMRRAWRAVRSGREEPYFLYCVGALVVFVIAFSGFSNFGILARERTVIQPLFLVFLSLPNTIDAERGEHPDRGPRLPARRAR